MKIEDLKKLVEAAAGGPWDTRYDDDLDYDLEDIYINSPNFSHHIAVVRGTNCGTNARFIIASRTAMPKLLKLAEAAKAYGKEIGFRTYSEDYHGSSYCEIMADLATDLEEALKALESE